MITACRSATSVLVEAPARLHFGVLDLRGSVGRRFGGMGAAIPEPGLVLEAERAAAVEVEGPEPERARAAEFARRFLASQGLAGGARIRLVRVVPSHAGLGSGTQLGLAVGTALGALYDRPLAPPALARAVGRGLRSAIGTWAFALGGFILEGGRRDGSAEIAPLLARHPMPESWRCVLAIPRSAPGLSGEAEAAAFRTLPAPDAREVERVAHLVLMQLLPALVEADLPAFGAALTEVQRVTGGWFAASQGGRFAPGPTAALVAAMAAAGAAGVGQSSWGPTVYGLAGSDREAEVVADAARRVLGAEGQVRVTPFAGAGAELQRVD